RRVRQAGPDLDEWRDPANVTLQSLKLTAGGVQELSFHPAALSRLPKQPVAGAPLKSERTAHPEAVWHFDEGLALRPYARKDVTVESMGGVDCAIEGDVAMWKSGVSGTALAFDGYKSSVVCPAERAPKLKDALTIEAWVVLGALPWNWAPLVHQSRVDPGPIEKGNYDEFGKTDRRKPGSGYYLGVDAHGRPIVSVNGQVLQGTARLTPYRWTHVAATYGDGAMSIYVDGQACGTTGARGPIQPPDADLVIGLNNVPGRATDPVRGPICHLAGIYGIEGLIDEVRIYDEALSGAAVANSYQQFKPDPQRRDQPDLERRTLPGRPGVATAFGATHTNLGYHELWNVSWRETDYADLLVKFDESPVSVAFWRGVNGGVGWVTENNKWMSDQSLERFGPHGCSEHMSDKENRHAHVRLIENSDARVVVHWRYASIDVDYLFPNIRDWTDEYYYIYPDCVAVRK
ncbi:MAG: LamG domain-containing protein, partial [Planctomycetota bacterium]